jgi:ribosomal protein L44E
MDKQSRMELRRKAGYRDLPKPVIKVQGADYAMSFACFICKTSNMRHFDALPRDYPKTMECPVCKSTAVNLGRQFKAPKKSDAAQWKKVKFLVEHGFVFQKIRIDPECCDSIPYPDTLGEAKDFVLKYKKWAWVPTL